jgi:hypothetical protein
MTTMFLIPSFNFFSLSISFFSSFFSLLFFPCGLLVPHMHGSGTMFLSSIFLCTTRVSQFSKIFTFLHSLCPCPSFHSSFFFCYCFLRFFNPLYPLTTEYIFYCKRAILFLSSSKILTPHPPLRPASVYRVPRCLCCGGRTDLPGG